MKFEKFKIILLAAFLTVCMPVSGFGKDNPHSTGRRVDLGIRFQDYRWLEYDNDGKKLLKESGPLYGVICDIESPGKLIGWRTGGNIFFGQADYEGQTWANQPVTTDVFYSGGKIFIDALPGYRLDSGLWLKSFAGLGLEFWLRDLNDTKTSAGDPVKGTREWWAVIYGRAGLGAEYPLANDFIIFAEAGLKLPVYTRNEAEFFVSGNPRVGLEPEQDYSGFGSIGLRWREWGAKISYDSLRFDRSDTVSSGFFNLYQPKSKADVYCFDVFWSKGF